MHAQTRFNKKTMKNSTLESLPNELLLIVFGYLSSFDLCRAFLDVKNARIKHLLTTIHHSLDVSSMHYDQLCKFLSNINNDTTKHFIALIDTVVLDDSSACTKLVSYWEKTLNEREVLNIPSLSITRLLILNAECYKYALVQPLLTSLVHYSNTLRYLHLVFERPSDTYSTILSKLIGCRISVHTMILEVEKGHEFYSNDSVKSLYEMQPLYWSHTVKLTLSIQHSSELLLLLKRDALPILEHLNVINEALRFALPQHRHKPVPNIHLCDHDLHETSGGTRLRSLLLRNIALNDVIILIGSLTMSLLEKLTLIDSYDQTLDHLGRFQELCGSTHLPSLKNLHFSFCFPQEMEHAWRMSPFSCNGEWPFANIGYYIDESLFSADNELDFVSKTQFIIYKRPINVLLQHKRTFHNHRFAAHALIPTITTRRRSVELTYDQMGDPDQLLKTLQVVASSHLNKLQLAYLEELTNVSITSSYSSSCDLLLYHLRSMTFNFESESIKRSQRVAIVKQILDASSNLSHLQIEWNDFRCCSKTYANLKHVHIVLDRLSPEPKQHFNVRQLAQLAPHLCRLETSFANITLNENLVKFVLKIIRRFHQLVYLILNKDSLYPSKEEKKIMFKERLIAAGHGRLFDCNNVQIGFSFCDELSIWL